MKFNPYWILHNYNFLVISILGGLFLIDKYPYFPKIIGLLFSSICFWYLSKFVSYTKEVKQDA